MLKILVKILPLSAFLWFGRRLGELSFFLIKSRRKIVTENLTKAFPDLTSKQRRALRLAHFRSVGMGLTESLYAWNADPLHLKTLAKVRGLEHLPDNQGAIIMFYHFTSLEMGCSLLALHTPLDAVYRRQNDLKMNTAMERGRKKFVKNIIANDDLRPMLKNLKSHNTLLYASDQHSTKGDWALVNFFNQKMAVTTASSRIAKATGAKVLPLSIVRDKNIYKITLHSAFEEFGEDAKQDAQTMMSWAEAEARKTPEQYFWIHNVFKLPPVDSLDRRL